MDNTVGRMPAHDWEKSGADAVRVLVCGGPGVGKSTLIERVCANSHGTARSGAADGGPDTGYDAVYRNCGERGLVLADVPGDDAHTGNMASVAVGADLAVVVVDAREGLPVQARRQAYIAHAFGVRGFVLAVNKMDLVARQRQAFDAIVQDFHDYTGQFGMDSAAAVPVSALNGANVLAAGSDMAWYRGPTLEALLGALPTGRARTVAPTERADQFEAEILWMGEAPMLPGRPYVIRHKGGEVSGQLAAPKYTVNVESLEHTAANTLEWNDIGVCNLALDEDIPFTAFADNRAYGRFVVVDRFSGEITGLGAIHFALRRASNIHWQALDINKAARARQKRQKPCVLWFTGLSGSGKSTIANLVEKRLLAQGAHTYLLDGDNVRHGLNRDLGFTDADRVENIRRVAEVARLMADSGLIVLVSFISPFRSERLLARELMDDGEFYEVFIDTPLDVCEQRDVKGLYAKARRGEIRNFTGIDSAYEAPEAAEIVLRTVEQSAEDAASKVVEQLDADNRLAIAPR